jgi:hypothetical protein
VSTLSVELNGDAVHSIRAPDRFEATGSFAVTLENKGRSTHVHLHFDDDLDRFTSVAETNHYVEDEAIKTVYVSVNGPTEPVRGKVKIVTGYGSNVRYVDVRLDPPEAADTERVVVDESFSKPPESTPAVPPTRRAANAVERLVERGGIPGAVAGFLALAVGVAIAVALDSAVVSVVVAVALIASLAAVALAV